MNTTTYLEKTIKNKQKRTKVITFLLNYRLRPCDVDDALKRLKITS